MYAKIESGEVVATTNNLREKVNGLLPRTLPDQYENWFKVRDDGASPEEGQEVSNSFVALGEDDLPFMQYEYSVRAYTQAELHQINHDERERVILEGPTYDDGVGRVINPQADTRTLVFFTDLALKAMSDPDFVYPGYRARNGIFDLTAAEILAIKNLGLPFIRDAFLTYNANEAAIHNGEMTLPSEVKAAYEAL